ncbi:uncharacterized protein Triagg1_9405 [Trichoderma aggressivum f. europaeum]|uniref:Uncharacterized protein n=1 Tax=Trichoderma aggressivum f. europaeum TaxID=173218 RepID=A0AAE1LZ41_9HYPO|nr:hypothetical protein Triagg1_9405 [Trichoderma aggressivum f. europaeum]
MTYFKSFKTSKKGDEYGRLTHDDEDGENADIHVNPGSHRKTSTLTWLLVSNSILALAVVGLSARIFSQPLASTTSTHYSGVGPVQLLEDQLGIVSTVIETYQFFDDDLDPYDFSKGDPYWASLFPKGGGQCFLDDEVVASYKLPPSLRHPGKGNFTGYEMAGYHSLHCLDWGAIRYNGPSMDAYFTLFGGLTSSYTLQP